MNKMKSFKCCTYLWTGQSFLKLRSKSLSAALLFSNSQTLLRMIQNDEMHNCTDLR